MKYPWHATTRELLFVPAVMEHRFEEMSDDFGAWVMFYGPVGGGRDNPFSGGD